MTRFSKKVVYFRDRRPPGKNRVQGATSDWLRMTAYSISVVELSSDQHLIVYTNTVTARIGQLVAQWHSKMDDPNGPKKGLPPAAPLPL